MTTITYDKYTDKDKQQIQRLYASESADGKPYTVTLPDSGDTLVVRPKSNHPFRGNNKTKVDLISEGLNAIKTAIDVGKAAYNTGKTVYDTAKSGFEVGKELFSQLPPIPKIELPFTKKPKMRSGKKSVTKKKVLSALKQAGTKSLNAPTSVLHAAPVSIGATVSRRNNRPQIRRVGNGVTISHSELVTGVNASSSAGVYECKSYIANAGSSALLPWLSNLANSYEKYRFRRLMITYVPMCSTSSAGKVSLGFDFDSSDPMPADRTEFFSLTAQTSGPVWTTNSLDVRCDNVVRFVGTHYSTDSKLVDLGQVLIATEGASASLICGDVIITYEVELTMPQQALYSTQAIRIPAYNSAANLLGTTYATIAGPRVLSGLNIQSSTTIRFVIPPGNFLIFIDVGSTNVGAIDPTPSVPIGTATLDTKFWRSNDACAVLLDCNSLVGATLQIAYSGTTNFIVNNTSIYLTASRVARPVSDTLDW